MRLALATLVFLAPAWAQQEGVAGSDISQPDFASGDFTILHKDLSAPPIYVTGRVRVSSGEPLPEPARVRLRCDGSDRLSTVTSGKGDFRINLSKGLSSVFNGYGRSQTAFGRMQGDRPGRIDVSGCALHAVLAGYNSSEIQLLTRDALANPDVGDLVLRPVAGGGGGTISVTTQEAPKRARRLYEKALIEVQEEEPDFQKAEGWLEAAVEEFPRYAAAWDLLGRTQLGLGKADEALESLRSSMEADSGFIRPYPRLVKELVRRGKYAEAIDVGSKALAIDPTRDDVRLSIAVAQLRLDRITDAVATTIQIIQRGTAEDHPQAYQVLGMAHAELGNYRAAVGALSAFLELSPDASAADEIRAKVAEWEAVR